MVTIGAVQYWNGHKQDVANALARDTHTLVNSQMGAQKKLLADVTAAKAAITKTPEDKQAAADAWKDWQDHVAKQNRVDDEHRNKKE